MTEVTINSENSTEVVKVSSLKRGDWFSLQENPSLVFIKTDRSYNEYFDLCVNVKTGHCEALQGTAKVTTIYKSVDINLK